MSDGGKGSKPRPFSVSHDEWSNRWDAIFARDLETPEETSKQETTDTKEKDAKDLQ
jgi:hypothetical protein